mmetsp:Transcript_4927/g.10395  ORF Transcript_4927/g.10395 Transcript_4927/m.10395 type:complete len:238 (+) Transcript_4927:373-1086(+)
MLKITRRMMATSSREQSPRPQTTSFPRESSACSVRTCASTRPCTTPSRRLTEGARGAAGTTARSTWRSGWPRTRGTRGSRSTGLSASRASKTRLPPSSCSRPWTTTVGAYSCSTSGATTSRRRRSKRAPSSGRRSTRKKSAALLRAVAEEAARRRKAVRAPKRARRLSAPPRSTRRGSLWELTRRKNCSTSWTCSTQWQRSRPRRRSCARKASSPPTPTATACARSQNLRRSCSSRS